MNQLCPHDVNSLHRLRASAFVEGFTMLLLLGIAVPLKHVSGLSVAVSVMGPIHGAAFVIYLWMVFNTAPDHPWTTSEIGRLLLAALIPLGAFFSIAFLNREIRRLTEQAAVGLAAGAR